MDIFFPLVSSISLIVSILWIRDLVISGELEEGEDPNFMNRIFQNKKVYDSTKTAKQQEMGKPYNKTSKALKKFILACLCLVIAVIVTAFLVLAFKPESGIWDIVGGIAGIFGILIVLVDRIASAI